MRSACLVLLAAALAGCGGASKPPAPAERAAAADGAKGDAVARYRTLLRELEPICTQPPDRLVDRAIELRDRLRREAIPGSVLGVLEEIADVARHRNAPRPRSCAVDVEDALTFLELNAQPD